MKKHFNETYDVLALIVGAMIAAVLVLLLTKF